MAGYNNSKYMGIVIELKDNDTGEVTIHKSLSACGRHLGICQALVRYYLNKGVGCLFHDKYQVREYVGEAEWPDYTFIVKKGTTYTRPIKITDITDGKSHSYVSIREAIRKFGYSDKTFVRAIASGKLVGGRYRIEDLR